MRIESYQLVPLLKALHMPRVSMMCSIELAGRATMIWPRLKVDDALIDSDIIELAHARSVSYHGPELFLEVLPSKDRINLLLAVDFNEVEDRVADAERAGRLVGSHRSAGTASTGSGDERRLLRPPA